MEVNEDEFAEKVAKRVVEIQDEDRLKRQQKKFQERLELLNNRDDMLSPSLTSFNECLERELSSSPAVSNVRRIAQGIRESFKKAFKGGG